MSALLSLGAIDESTNEYVFPRDATKNRIYKCPECGKSLIVCKGDIRAHHFRHKSCKTNTCTYYDNPSESQIHKDAKHRLKTLLKTNKLSFSRCCSCCDAKEEFEIPEVTESSHIEIEHRFRYNCSVRVADVAYVDDNEIICIFEICNTHRTSEHHRPEPWFEIDATALIKTTNNTELSQLCIPCIRNNVKCEECVIKEESDLKIHNIDKYVRLKLGQKYPEPQEKHDGVACDCCLFDSFKPIHDRLEFDAQYTKELIDINMKILNSFEDDFMDKRVVIHTYRGGGDAFIISKQDYLINYDQYWDDWDWLLYNTMLKRSKRIHLGGLGTVEIFKKLIRYCENSMEIKKEAIKAVKNKINQIRIREFKHDSEPDGNDAEVYRSLRWSRQQSNEIKALEIEIWMIKNDIDYVIKNHVAYIEHPLTCEKIRRSLIKNKTFYKGKWIPHIPLKCICNWYHSNYIVEFHE